MVRIKMTRIMRSLITKAFIRDELQPSRLFCFIDIFSVVILWDSHDVAFISQHHLKQTKNKHDLIYLFISFIYYLKCLMLT